MLFFRTMNAKILLVSAFALSANLAFAGKSTLQFDESSGQFCGAKGLQLTSPPEMILNCEYEDIFGLTFKDNVETVLKSQSSARTADGCYAVKVLKQTAKVTRSGRSNCYVSVMLKGSGPVEGRVIAVDTGINRKSAGAIPTGRMVPIRGQRLTFASGDTVRGSDLSDNLKRVFGKPILCTAEPTLPSPLIECHL